MVLTLYKLDGSPPARSVLMTIEALKIPDVEYVDVNFLKGENHKKEYLKMNPQHTIPLLKDDDFVIWDSHAIGAYLVSTYGKDDSLYPTDPKKRAIIDQRLHFDSGILFPAMRGVAELVLFYGEKKLRDESIQKIQSAYEFTDKFLTTDWIAGHNLTLADICCVSTISSLNEVVPIDQEKYKNLWAWLQRCSQLEFYKTKNEPGLQNLRDVLMAKLEG